MIEPLFILAPPRSFTSVTCAMIGQHPEMMGLPETNLFAADTYAGLQRMYRMRPRFRFGLLRSVAQLGLGAQTEDTVRAAAAWLEENPDISTAELFADLVAWADGRGTVDKSPLYVYAPGALQRAHSGAPIGLKVLHESQTSPTSIQRQCNGARDPRQLAESTYLFLFSMADSAALAALRTAGC